MTACLDEVIARSRVVDVPRPRSVDVTPSPASLPCSATSKGPPRIAPGEDVDRRFPTALTPDTSRAARDARLAACGARPTAPSSTPAFCVDEAALSGAGRSGGRKRSSKGHKPAGKAGRCPRGSRWPGPSTRSSAKTGVGCASGCWTTTSRNSTRTPRHCRRIVRIDRAVKRRGRGRIDRFPVNSIRTSCRLVPIVGDEPRIAWLLPAEPPHSVRRVMQQVAAVANRVVDRPPRLEPPRPRRGRQA